jgi:hypothetical protein
MDVLRLLAGGGPAATHLLCLAKEGKRRKATAPPSPAGAGALPPHNLRQAKNGK